MIDLATWGLFGVAVLALFASPGPNMAFVLSHGVAHGPRGGFALARKATQICKMLHCTLNFFFDRRITEIFGKQGFGNFGILRAEMVNFAGNIGFKIKLIPRMAFNALYQEFQLGRFRVHHGNRPQSSIFLTEFE